MAEHDGNNNRKERALGGETSITPSSDAAIEAALDELRRRIEDRGQIVDVAAGDIYPPKLVSGTIAPIAQNKGTESTLKVISLRQTPRDSAFAKRLHQERQEKKLEKAA